MFFEQTPKLIYVQVIATLLIGGNHWPNGLGLSFQNTII
jgi:hypothetical protein